METTGNHNETDEKGNNIIVMSEAGKPIYSRYGSNEEITRQCGLVQAIRTAINGNVALELGEIQSLHSQDSCMVFMTVGGITLVSISKVDKQTRMVETETFCRLQLEYIFAQLIFTLTEQVQSAFMQDPGFDLRSVMNSGENLLHGLLDEAGPLGNAGPFLVAGVQSLFPIPHRLRKKASQTLQNIGSKIENIAFALIVAGNKLLTLVQPSYRPHHLRVSDLHLILNFVSKQPGLLTSELWMPMCLPRFNSSGFLYAYANCWDVQSKLTLILVSSHNTTEQFQLFRAASTSIRDELGIPADSDHVLTINTSSNPDEETPRTDNDVDWSRDESVESEEDYVTVQMDGTERRKPEPFADSALLREVRESACFSTCDSIFKKYMDDNNEDMDSSLIMHFLFRVDIPVKHNTRQGGNGKGHLTQCISPSPIPPPFDSVSSRRRLWTHFQKLNLRLRLGSSTVESTMDAFDMITQDEATAEDGFPGIAKDCPAIGLLESPPNVHGVTYVIDQNEIFLAMNGPDFELYMVSPNTIPIKKAAALGTKLVRRLKASERRLFLTSPLTWKE